MGRRAAFFDFDRTLLHGDAGVIFGWTLTEWGYAKGRDMPRPDRRRYQAHITAQIVQNVSKAVGYRALNAVGLVTRSRLVELGYSFLEGFPAAEMSERMDAVWEEKLRERLYPEMLQVIEEHRHGGDRIAIVTTGLTELVSHSRKVLGDDIDVIGTHMRESGGMWEGKVDGPLYGVHKAQAVRAYAEEHDIDLKASHAYSDHYSDIAFLGSVGNPVAVNPGMRLRMHARKHGWATRTVLPPRRPSGSAE